LPSGPTAVVWEGRTGAGSGRLPPSRWPRYRPATTRITVRLPPSRLNRHERSTRLAVAPGGYPAPRSLGLHPLRRTRCAGQVGLALACLHRQPEAASHTSTQPRQLPGSILFGRWPAAVGMYASMISFIWDIGRPVRRRRQNSYQRPHQRRQRDEAGQ